MEINDCMVDDDTLEAAELREARKRIAMLERIRERLNEGAARLANERASAQARLQYAVQEIELERRGNELLQAERSQADLQTQAKEATLLRIEAVVRDLTSQLYTTKVALSDSLASSIEREAEIDGLLETLATNAALVVSLSDAQARAADVNARIDFERLQVEVALCARLEEARAKNARNDALIRQLIADRAALAQMLRLREDRIATLDAVLRQVASDTVRSIERELEQYRALHATLLASKIVLAGNWVRRALRGRVVLPAFFKRPKRKQRPSKPTRRPASVASKVRHLRSA